MPPSVGVGKRFSTSATRPWQYATSADLRIAGPSLLKKTEATRVSVGEETLKTAPIPIALKFRAIPNNALPDISKSQAAKERLAEMVEPVPPIEHQSTMKNEKDVM